ncbi:hypothetical protein AAMO2058_000604300 [Amorphochlora amoebiformis]
MMRRHVERILSRCVTVWTTMLRGLQKIILGAVAGGGSLIPALGLTAEADGSQDEDFELVQVQVLFRHGARTTVYPYPKDMTTCWNLCGSDIRTVAYKVVGPGEGKEVPPLVRGAKYGRNRMLKGGCYSGQLTDLGKLQARQLGLKLGSRYSGLVEMISKDPSLLYVRSTNYPRTQETAAHVLTGLLPSNWSLLTPIHTVHFDEEYLVANQTACPRLSEFLKEGKRMYAKVAPSELVRIRLELENKLGEEGIKKLKLHPTSKWKGMNLMPTRDILRCMSTHGMELPEWGSYNLANETQRLAGKQIAYLLQHDGKNQEVTNEITRLGIGRFLGKVCESMEQRVSDLEEGSDVAKGFSSSKAKVAPVLSLYSGHDTSMLPVLISYQLYHGDWPTYCSSVAWELYRSKPKAWTQTDFSSISYKISNPNPTSCLDPTPPYRPARP